MAFLKTVIEIPDKNKLREFGITTGIILAVLFGLLLPWVFDHRLPIWPWILASILVLWALVQPASLKSLYIVWMKFGHVLGFVNTRIILGVMYYLIFVPTGLIMRIMGKDPMAKTIDGHVMSYRVTKHEIKDRKHMEKPY